MILPSMYEHAKKLEIHTRGILGNNFRDYEFILTIGLEGQT